MSIRQVGGATLGVLLGLQVLDSVDGAMFVVFAPEIRESLGLSPSAIAIVSALAGVTVSIAALPLGMLGDRHPRTVIAGVCTLAWAVAAALLGLVTTLWQAVAIRILAGLGKANEGPIQAAILTDAYPTVVRGRVLGIHRGGQPLGIIAGPLLAAAVAAVVPAGQEAWRWAFLLLAVPALLLGVATLRLPEPSRGIAPGPAPTLWAAFARLRRIRTFYLVMLSLGAFGLCVTTIPVYLFLILEDQLGQGVTARGVIASVGSAGGLAGAVLGGIYADRLFRRSPAASLYLAGGAIATLGVGFALQAYAPTVAAFLIVGTVTQALLFAGLVSLSLIVASVTPPDLRATGFALVGLYLAVVGGFGGALITAVAEQAWGPRTAIAVVAPTASVVAGLLLVAATRHLSRDLAQVAGVHPVPSDV